MHVICLDLASIYVVCSQSSVLELPFSSSGISMCARVQVFPPMTLHEVFESMFGEMDRLFRIVRPRRLLYLAVGACIFICDIKLNLFLDNGKNIQLHSLRKESGHIIIINHSMTIGTSLQNKTKLVQF